METDKILRMLNRKAIFSVSYLVIALAFITAYFYFWHLHEYDYAYNAESPVSALNLMLGPFYVLVIMVITSVIYFVHFICGSFYYRNKYKREIEMNMDLSNPEDEKEPDTSYCRGLIISLIWSMLFLVAFYGTIPTLTLYVVSFSWVLLHIALMFLTKTEKLFTLTTRTIDLTIIMPEEYKEDEDKEHTYVDLYFFTPTSVGESAWCEMYIKEYIKNQKVLLIEEKADIKKIEDFSRKLARS